MGVLFASWEGGKAVEVDKGDCYGFGGGDLFGGRGAVGGWKHLTNWLAGSRTPALGCGGGGFPVVIEQLGALTCEVGGSHYGTLCGLTSEAGCETGTRWCIDCAVGGW